MLLKTITITLIMTGLALQKFDFCVGTLVCVDTFAVQNVVSESVFQLHYKKSWYFSYKKFSWHTSC